MITAKDILDSNGVEVEFNENGFIAKTDKYLVLRSESANYENVLRTLFLKGHIKHEYKDVYASAQSIYELYGNEFSVIKHLEDLGFLVLDAFYDSFGPTYLIKIAPSDIELPKWASYY